MEELQKRIGYEFQDKDLLKTALTHSSYANESRGKNESNERLEFLGDSVLSLVVSQKLYREYSDCPEGELTRLRAGLVCEDSLCSMARSLELGDFLFLGKGERAGGGDKRPSILADAFEALLGALFLDAGIEQTEMFLSKRLENIDQRDDYKTRLQEYVQKHFDNPLIYDIISETGPDHDKTFETQVSLNGEVLGHGTANSKKAAQQQAAKQALSNIAEKTIKLV